MYVRFPAADDVPMGRGVGRHLLSGRNQSRRVRLFAACLACSVVATLVTPAVASAASREFLVSSAAEAPAAPGEIVVRWESGVEGSERSEIRDSLGAEQVESFSQNRSEVVRVDGGVQDAIEELEADPAVAFAEPNYIYE